MLYVVKPSLSRYKSDKKVKVNYCRISRNCRCEVIDTFRSIGKRTFSWNCYLKYLNTKFGKNCTSLHSGATIVEPKERKSAENVMKVSCNAMLTWLLPVVIFPLSSILPYISGIIITFTCTLRILAKLDGGPHESAHFRWDRKGWNKISGDERSCCCLQLSKLMRSYRNLCDLQNTG